MDGIVLVNEFIDVEVITALIWRPKLEYWGLIS
jgi:hypothetical protein